MRGPCVGLIVLFALVGPGAAAGGADPFQELSLFRPAKSTTAPEFTVPRVGGTSLSLRDHRGQVVFLNFWATWCPPCKEEMPSMERLYRRFKDREFTILALSIDTGEATRVQEFAGAFGLTFPIGLDPTLEVANLYAIRGLPASFLIDKSGRIAAVAVGPRDWDSRAAHAVVESLLK